MAPQRESLLGVLRALENLDRLATSGMFGPPVAVAADASIQDRQLGVFGRDPAWTPPPP
jgi:hypothetical protein